MSKRSQFVLVSFLAIFAFAIPNSFAPLANAQAASRPDAATAILQTHARSAALRAHAVAALPHSAGASQQAATPQFSVSAGSYSDTQTISITDSTPGATIYCSTNGTYPNVPSSLLPNPPVCPASLTVSSSEVVVAVAVASGYSTSAYASAQYNIASSNTPYVYSIAGNDAAGCNGNGSPALLAQLGNMEALAVDSSGNVYVADGGCNVVRKISASTGTLSVFAGTGAEGDTGDGGPASSAELWQPVAVAVDASGNVYIAESGDNVVRKVNTSGVITTYAGNPSGTGGNDSPANTIPFTPITALTFDSAGNLYVATQSLVWQVNATSGIATQYAGGGWNYGSASNGGSATSAGLLSITGIAIDKQGNLYIVDQGYSVVRKVNSQGIISTVAGVWSYGLSDTGDGGPATSAPLEIPWGIAVDSAGNFYIADSLDYAIREVNVSTGIINTVVGVFDDPYTVSGDGSPATSVGLDVPQHIAIDGSGNIYLADYMHQGVRKITAPGAPPTQTAAAPTFSVASGTYPGTQTVTISDATPGSKIYVSFNGLPATAASEGYHGPIDVSGSVAIQAVAVGPGYLPSTATSTTYTITTPPDAIISTIAGNGHFGFSGSGGLATSAELGETQAVALDAAGNLYIADSSQNVVWKVIASTQNISVVAGNGTAGFSGDNGQATAAELNQPSGVAVDKSGNLYISDSSNSRIRIVAAATGTITTVAGPGNILTLGDGGPATSAFLGTLDGLVIDNANNLYIADVGTSRIRKIDLGTGIISTVAGGGVDTTTFENGMSATDAYIQPLDVAVDSAGNVYFPDTWNVRILKVSASNGTLTTVAGNGIYSNMDGDGGPATQAAIAPTQGIAVDASGNVYFSDRNAAVRKVDASTGILTTPAGNYYLGYGGDGGAAEMAGLDLPQGLALDTKGSLYVADCFNYVVRKVTFPSPAPAPSFSLPSGSYIGEQKVSITDTAQGAAIYYTTDGSTPTTASTEYTQPLALTSNTTLQAIAVVAGYTESSAASASYTISMLTPSIALTASANPAFASNSITFSAAVSSASGTPAGTVAFLDGSAQLGTGTLSGGTATFSTSSLTSGTHSITAVYSGDTTFLSVTSSALTETVENFTFGTSSGSSNSATASPGGTATYTLAVTPPSGETTPAAITFSVSGLPTGATATFSPTSVPAGSGATNVTLSVTVPSQSSATLPLRSPSGRRALPMALGLALLPLALLRRNRSLFKHMLILFAFCAASTLGMAALSGCGGNGGSGSGGGGSQPQSYNLTVSATSGTLTNTTQLTLTVN